MLYILFAVLLGAVCSRYALLTDYMIASKVSLVGVLFLFGLYVSSLSSCLGAQYGAPRVLQCISKENVVPLIKSLGKGVRRFIINWWQFTKKMWFFCVCVVMISIKESNWTILWAGRAQPNLIKNDQLELAFSVKLQPITIQQPFNLTQVIKT